MPTPVEQSTYTLQITRVIPAAPQRVFEAWTDPRVLVDWFAPADQFTTIVHAVELRIGGRYRIEMVDPSGKPHTAIGVYKEIVPGERLAFTWKWEENPAMDDTLVTLDFLPHGEETELVLTHSLFLTAETRDHHGKGWNGMMPRLATLMQVRT
jgi:uncharacterized protein YndB with AHSA1/START domain